MTKHSSLAAVLLAAAALAPHTGCAVENDSVAGPPASSGLFAGVANSGDVAAARIGNARLDVSVTVDRGVLRGVKLTDKVTGRTLNLGEPFTLNLLGRQYPGR